VSILNARSASSSETNVRNGIINSKAHMYFHQLNAKDLLVVFNSAIELRTATSQPDLDFENFKRHSRNGISLNALKRDIFECISWCSTVRFSAVMIAIF
jgi:hypothetical protein